MLERIKDAFRNHWLEGILLLLAGLFMLLWPQASLKILCVVLGIILIVIGVINLLSLFSQKYAEKKESTLALSIGAIVLGILIIVLSRFFVSVFLIIAGLILLFGCIMLFRRAYQLRDIKGKDFAISLILGIIILILGIVMIINPVGTASFVIQLIGVALILFGLGTMFIFHDKVQ